MSWRDRDVTVAGGAGFIGSWLVRKLLQLGAKISVVDNFERGKIENLLPYIESLRLVKGDLMDHNFATHVLKGSEIVFDLTSKLGGIRFLSENPAQILRTNLQMALNIAEAARKNEVERILFVSSSCVYGNETAIPNLERCAAYSPPESSYGWSKIVGEKIYEAYKTQYGMNSYIVRPFNVYGPREDFEKSPHVIPQFIRRVFKGNPIVIYGDGKQTRSFTYVSDVVDGMIRCIESNYVCVPFNLGSNNETSINEIASLIIKLCDPKLKVQVKHEAEIDGDIRRRAADNRLARQLLGWEPEVDLRTGLSNTIQWYGGVTRRD